MTAQPHQGEKILLGEIKKLLAARFNAGMNGYEKRTETVHLIGGAWLITHEAPNGSYNRDKHPAMAILLYWKGERYRFGYSNNGGMSKPPRWSKG
jgi:hypothetical protein